MVGEKTIQNSLFALLHSIAEAQSPNEVLPLFIIVIYMAELLFSFFIFVNPNNIISQNITTSALLSIAVVIGSGVIIIELAITLLYRVQLQLFLQLMFFRFILFPMALLLLVQQIQNPKMVSTEIAIVLYSIIVVVTYFVNFIIHSYSSQSVFRVYQNASSWIIFTDCLFFLIKLLKGFYYMEMVLLFILAANLIIRYKLRNYQFFNKREQFEYFSIIVKEFLVAILLARNVIQVSTDSTILLIFSVPLIFMILLYEGTKYAKITLDEKVFKAKASIEIFYTFINSMSQELVKFKNNQNSDFQHSLLLVFIAIHKTNCSNPSCLLAQKSTEEQIRNCNSSNNMKILKHKIIKKLEYLFEIYEQKHNDNIKLKLLLISFYLNHLPNKLKLSLLITSVKSMSLNWNERMVFFGLKEKIDQIEMVQELIDITKTEDDYTEFKKLLINAVGCFQEFWGRVLEERVDVNQLMAISEKLFPLKKSIQQVWRKHLNEQTFSSWSILKTYTFYRRNIMHDYTNSVILEGYCKIIQQRLKSKHEMSYINSQTEQAVVAISLTESSLGNIASLNFQACKLFNFTSKSEMLELRVNDIMPSVYSVVHDNILSSFLKNRYKDINQDQRFVFGKNKNGYIFPFLLQLRKLSWSINDQLIFIAHLVSAKIRTAPIFCITDLQGDIQDYTSTFAWLFMKKIKNNLEIKRKNIQEMIPSFFQVIQNSLEQCRKVKFPEKTFSHKNGHNIEIQFSASQVYIKSEKVGYLIEGTNSQLLQPFHNRKNINSILTSFYEQNHIYSNNYNHTTLVYELPNQGELANKKITNQFTIPFIKTSDLEGIITYEKKQVQYDKNIKTFRLFRGKLEHVAEEESFNSDEDSFELKQISVIKKIEKMKEELNVNQHSNTGDYFKITVLLITIFLIGMICVIFFKTSVFESSEVLEIQEIEHKLDIRQLFPEYLIYTFFPQYTSRQVVTNIRDDLKHSIVSSDIQQIKKEQILQQIYLSQTSTTLQLNPLILTFSSIPNDTHETIVELWYLTTVVAFLYIVCLFIIYFLFKFKISNIYTIFVSINENKLIQIKDESHKLLEFLSLQTFDYYKVAPLQEFKREDLQQAQFHRMKKMKNDYTFEDLTNLSQLILPAFIILLYSIFCSIFAKMSFANYNGYLSAWSYSAELLPETSLALMEALINRNKIGNLSLSSSYFSIEQQFEYIIISENYGPSELLPLLKGDPCTNSAFASLSLNISSFCEQSNLFMQYSFSNVINYMSSILINQNANATIDWPQLISLEFGFLKPLLQYVTSVLAQQVVSLRHSCEQNIIIFGIIYIYLAIMVGVYIICYPLFKIYEKILFTTDLIKILPSDQEKQPQLALAAMTTEAMQIF